LKIEYSCECGQCRSETIVDVIDDEGEPLFCSMCGQEANHNFLSIKNDDGEEIEL